MSPAGLGERSDSSGTAPSNSATALPSLSIVVTTRCTVGGAAFSCPAAYPIASNATAATDNARIRFMSSSLLLPASPASCRHTTWDVRPLSGCRAGRACPADRSLYSESRAREARGAGGDCMEVDVLHAAVEALDRMRDPYLLFWLSCGVGMGLVLGILAAI